MNEREKIALLLYWDELLKKEGLPAELEPEKLGIRVPLGDGLGRKTDAEEKLEDRGGHSRTCPINLGHGLNGNIDQPNDRPLEK